MPLLLDAATFLGVAIAALLVRTRRSGVAASAETVRAREGIAFLRRDPILAPLVAALAAFVVFAMMVNVVEVFLVRDTLAAGATWYGALGATWAAGVVVGAIMAGRLASEHARVVGACTAAGVMSLVFLAFAASPSVLVLVPVSLIGGAANGVLNVAASAVVMTRTPDPIREFHVMLLVGPGPRGRELTLEQVRDGRTRVLGKARLGRGPVTLQLTATASRYAFSGGTGPRLHELGGIPTRAMSAETIHAATGRHHFTGAMIGLYATGSGRPARVPADFDWFELLPTGG